MFIVNDKKYALQQRNYQYIKQYWDWYQKYYFKRNVVTVGSPTFNNAVISGFTTSNYYILPSLFNPIDQDFELCFKFKLVSLNSAQGIFQVRNNNKDSGNAILLQVNSNNTIGFVTGYNNSSWEVNTSGTTVLSANTDYWVKATNKGLFLSLNGIDYFTEITYNVTRLPDFSASTVSSIGAYYNYLGNIENPFNGSIDLSESYIKINDNYWWRGVESTTISNSLSWIKPILNSNGTMGGSNFACAASSMYQTRYAYYFVCDVDNSWHSGGACPQWVTMYNPKPIKITELQMAIYLGGSGIIQGSNDNSVWTNLVNFNITTSNVTPIDLSSNTNYYKYYRFYCTSSGYGHAVLDSLSVVGTYEGDWSEDVLVSSNTRTFDGAYSSKVLNHEEIAESANPNLTSDYDLKNVLNKRYSLTYNEKRY